MIDYNVLATGSTGNCILLENEVMVDCGVPYKTVAPYIGGLRIVLLTHIHSDHFRPSTLRRLSLEKPLLKFACCDWLAKPLVDAGVEKRQIDILKPRMLYTFTKKVNDQVVSICNAIPVELHHDVPNCGYKLFFPKGKVFVATDTGSLAGISAKDYDLLMVESNYEDDEIQARMDAKLAEGMYAYERRVIQYHLSKRQADDWIYKNAGPDTEYVYLHCHVDRESHNEGQNH